jgi:hypothetical protein
MSVVEGSIGAIPRRLQVGAEDWARAYETLREAGLEASLIKDEGTRA